MQANSPTPQAPVCYEICVESHLPAQWADWFDGLAISHTEDGATMLRGAVADQAALFSLLRKVRDLGLVLVSVRRIPAQATKEIEK
jgi:hypothetical protein